MPYTIEQAKRALERVLDQAPPNKPKDEQYKDSAIWEAVIELGRKHAVRFISADKAFFENREYAQGLAKNLQRDCTQRGSSVEIHNDMVSCLSKLGNVAALPDRLAVEEAVTRLARTMVEASASVQDAISKGWVLEDVRLGRRVSPFLTTDPDELAIAFAVVFGLRRADPPGSGRRDITGSCLYHVSSGETGKAVAESESIEGVSGFTIGTFGRGPTGPGALDKRGLALIPWPSSNDER